MVKAHNQARLVHSLGSPQVAGLNGLMVLLATTREGFSTKRVEIIKDRNILWLADGVLSGHEVEELRNLGLDVTVFDDTFDVKDQGAVLDAIHTIKEHHPGEKVCIV